MKVPIYETSAGALAALLAKRQFVYAHLYTVTLANNAGVMRFTNADLDITDGVNVWSSRGIQVDTDRSRQMGHWKRGLDVDQWMLVLQPRSTDPLTGAAFPDQVNGVPFVQAAVGGAFDGADVQVDRAYFSAWPVPYKLSNNIPVGIITMFAGFPVETDCADNIVVLTLNDYRDLLSLNMPRHVYQSGCRHTLFDSGCTLLASAFKKSGHCATGTTLSTIISTLSITVNPVGGSFQLGKIVMTSGINNSFSRTISQWSVDDPQKFYLLNPLPFPIEPNASFDVYPGCDKSALACSQFSNSVNFGGQLYIPAPETAV